MKIISFFTFLLIMLNPLKSLLAQNSKTLPQNNYKEVKIGNQIWSTKNLDVSKFCNGDPILEAKTDEEWVSANRNKQPAWCYYNYDAKNGAKYGKLYNGYAVRDSRGLAPLGWHIPADAEWTVLEKYLGDNIGKKMKSISGWDSYTSGGSKKCPNCASWNAEYRKQVPCHKCKNTREVPAPIITHSGNGNNSSGFSALPGGERVESGYFSTFVNACYWWSSTAGESADEAWFHGLYKDFEFLLSSKCSIAKGLSVRCIKGAGTYQFNQTPNVKLTPKTDPSYKIWIRYSEGDFETTHELNPQTLEYDFIKAIEKAYFSNDKKQDVY